MKFFKWNINWKIRMKNKSFWVSIVSAIFVFIATIAGAFGVELDLTQTQNIILNVIELVFGALTVYGVVIDPTTKGKDDSERAMGYTELG